MNPRRLHRLTIFSMRSGLVFGSIIEPPKSSPEPLLGKPKRDATNPLYASDSFVKIPRMAETILSARDLVVRYNDQVVLDHASLVLHENERVGLVGRNGSGKSTF